MRRIFTQRDLVFCQTYSDGWHGLATKSIGRGRCKTPLAWPRQTVPPDPSIEGLHGPSFNPCSMAVLGRAAAHGSI